GAAVIEAMGRDVAKFDALVCVSDPVAFGCMSALQRMGLQVPDDVAITGFGQFEVAKVANPRITTVNVNAEEIGQQVV
ncbi:MAG: substrate-binding domain-containing protein, partial [Litoreibacter sp.]|nr:substrate-binding domain-containing protein [Litoreibacter sp.]